MTIEKQKKWVMLIRHLEAALALLDELDEGDGEPAAHAQRAVNTTKREMRRRFGRNPELPMCEILPFPNAGRSSSR